MLGNKIEAGVFPKEPLVGDRLAMGLLVVSDCSSTTCLFFFFLQSLNRFYLNQ